MLQYETSIGLVRLASLAGSRERAPSYSKISRAPPVWPDGNRCSSPRPRAKVLSPRAVRF